MLDDDYNNIIKLDDYKNNQKKMECFLFFLI